MTEEIRGTRREFVTSALAAAAAGSMLTAPSPAVAQTAGVTRLRVGLTPPDNQVTLAYQTTNSGGGPLTPMYEMLLATDRFTGDVIPQLAAEWETPGDGKTWRFKLRRDITFHDGSKLTAKDVVFSWQLITAADSRATQAAQFRQLVKSLDDIKVVNDYEVVFNLTRPELDFPFYVTQSYFIYSKDYWDKVGGAAGYAKAPVGTGSFRFKEFKPGEYILYERVEKHWRQTPDFRELQLLYMPEDSTRLAALLAGEVHIAEIPRAVQRQAVARGKKIVPSTRPAVHISSVFGGNYLSEKGANAPLTNKLVREAMNIAINRQEINEQIFNGRGEIETVEPYLRNDPIYNPDWKPYPYDPARARQLLAQAGYAAGFDFEMTVVAPPGFPEIPDVVEAMATSFKAIGLRPKLVTMELATQNTRQRAADFKNTVTTSRQSMQPLFQAIFYYQSKNIYHWFEDAHLDERLAKFSQSLDKNERQGIIREVGDYIYKEFATLPVLFLNAEVAVDPRVVAEYQADIGPFGASVSHEYTKAAR